MNIEWDAQGYRERFAYVTEFGLSALSLIDAAPGSRVLDLGCGTGELTAEIARRGYEVIGADSSPEMLATARAAYPHIRFIEADACDFVLDEPVDVVFSNSVLHWIDEARQGQVFERVAVALKPGGQFVFECGERDCIATVHAALAEAFAARGLTYVMPFHYPALDECVAKVRAAGLHVTHAAMFERYPRLWEGGMAAYIRMFLKAPFAGLDEGVANELVEDAVCRLRSTALYDDGCWVPDYMRLRLRAVRPR